LPNRFFELSSDLLCTAGFDGYFKRVNPAWTRTLGLTEPELLSRPYIEFVHPDDRERTVAETTRMAESPSEMVRFPNRYRASDGKYRWLEWNAQTVAGENLIYATARDVTAQRDAEDRVHRSEEKFRGLLEAAPDATVIVDEDGKIVLVNAQTKRLFGYEREELVGEPVERLVPIGFATVNGDAGLHAQDPRTQAMGVGPDLSARRKDGSEFPVEISLSPLKLDEGTLITAAIRDVTDRKRVEEAVETARRDAEHANLAKSEFLSRMSHELRTPLNSILGFGQLLEMDGLEQAQRDSVAQIMTGGRHLLLLIDEVLDISRIESGNLGISLEPVQLGSVVAEALSLIAPLAAAEAVRLDGDASEFEDWYVCADQQRLNQVLLNLLANGVKYNQEGGTVRIECRPRAKDRVEVAVVDTGRGMTPAQLEHLFEPFDRLGAEQTEVEGTGLGLALSKALVEAMEGTIRAESVPGSGTTVAIELERAQPPSNGGSPGASLGWKAGAGRRTVVYVEDNASNLKLVEGALSRMPDVRLIPAMRGKLGLDLIREHRPDLVLLDLHLPDLSGAEVLEKLQADPATRDVPVVVVSADATLSQKKRLFAAGASDYLTKPLDVRRLLELVATPPNGGDR
jgi:protein-histidine pros-kinase